MELVAPIEINHLYCFTMVLFLVFKYFGYIFILTKGPKNDKKISKLI